METPIAHNGGSANQVSPCDPITATSAVNNLPQGSGLDVSWANGHEKDTHTLSIAPFGQDTTVDDFTVLAAVPASTTQQPQHYELPASAFAKYSVGTKLTLRYSWDGYDNCATLVITVPTPAGASLCPPDYTNPFTNEPHQEGDYLLQDSANKTIGVLNIYSGAVSCASGYTASGNNCVPSSANDDGGSGSGMSAAGKFFLAMFIISVVGVAAFIGFSYYKTGDALHYVRKYLPGNKNNAAQPTTTATARNNGNYVAFSEPIQSV